MIHIEPYNECSVEDFANDIREQFKGKPADGVEFGFAKYQSKTSYIFPQLLAIKDIGNMEPLKGCGKTARVIFVVPVHATRPLKEVPLPIQEKERDWRGWSEENKERIKQGEEPITMEEYLALASGNSNSEEEDADVECPGCGTPMDAEDIAEHKRQCKEYKRKRLA